jgi:hypothetical protein
MTSNNPSQHVNNPQSSVEKSKSFNSLVRVFNYCGLFGIIATAIILVGGLSSGFSGIKIADALFNLTYAILFFICARLLAKGKVLAVWLCGAAILLSLIYSFIMGRGFNLIIAVIGAWFIWRLFSLKKLGEIS